ncbi:MAG TPA: hypothetical protein VFG24_04900 [Nitrosopumilaceae archaeon]|nr:hypothetical protein [Nitrosopumilaceae archaeon]
MSEQKTIRKSVKIAVIIAVVSVVSAGIVLAILQLTGISANSSQDNNAKTPGGQHTPTPTASDGDVKVGKQMRTKDNTGCVNPPSGPQIC